MPHLMHSVLLRPFVVDLVPSVREEIGAGPDGHRVDGPPGVPGSHGRRADRRRRGGISGREVELGRRRGRPGRRDGREGAGGGAGRDAGAAAALVVVWTGQGAGGDDAGAEGLCEMHVDFCGGFLSSRRSGDFRGAIYD